MIKQWPLVEEANELESTYEQWLKRKVEKHANTEDSKAILRKLMNEAYRHGHGVGHTRAEHHMKSYYGIYRKEGRL